MDDFPVSIKPIYSTSKVDKPVRLYAGKLILDVEGKTFHGTGSISLEWLPKPSVRWILKNSVPPLNLGITPSAVVLKAKSISNKMQGQLSAAHFSGGADAKSPSVEGYLDNGEGQRGVVPIQSVLFHLANFIPFLGDVIRDPAGKAWQGRATLRADGWKLTVDSTEMGKRSTYQENAGGGFAISHVACLERDDGCSFSVADAKKLLESLYWFFSFCRGRPCAPILPLGFDKRGRRQWSEWGNWNVARQDSSRNWFNDFSGEGLEGTFPGFCARDKNTLWSDPIKLAIYWYLEAGRVGNDTAIIIAQAAFELLAWTLLAEDKKAISKTGFRNFSAADQLRALLKFIGIPAAVPRSLANFDKLAIKQGWRDGPQALTGIRNTMVHSAGKVASVGATSHALFEASMLSLWYLELSILYLLGYAGKYSNRLVLSGWKGEEVESVPWNP
jgi:hypothetical protein